MKSWQTHFIIGATFITLTIAPSQKSRHHWTSIDDRTPAGRSQNQSLDLNCLNQIHLKAESAVLLCSGNTSFKEASRCMSNFVSRYPNSDTSLLAYVCGGGGDVDETLKCSDIARDVFGLNLGQTASLCRGTLSATSTERCYHLARESRIQVLEAIVLCRRSTESPVTVPPPIACYERSASLIQLNSPARVNLCSGSPTSNGPPDCFTRSASSSLQMDQRVTLCAGARNLTSPFSCLYSASSSNIDSSTAAILCSRSSDKNPVDCYHNNSTLIADRKLRLTACSLGDPQDKSF